MLLTESTMLCISCYMLAAQLFLLSQHLIHSVHSTNDNHGNQGVTYVWYFMYGIIKLCVKKIVYGAGDNVGFC